MLPLTPRRKTFLFSLLLAAILAGGAGGRAGAVKRARLWTDEYIMLEIAGEPTIPAVIRRVATENNPPLYHVLVHLAMRALDDAPRILRLVSFAASLATAVLAALIALRCWGRAPALIAGTLVSFSAVAIHYSAEIRPYSLLALIVLLQIWLLRRGLDVPTVALAAAQALLLVAALLLHYYAVMLLPLGPVLALARKDRRALAIQTGVSLAAAAAASPLVFAPMLQLPAGVNEYILNLWHGMGPAAPAWTLFQEILPSFVWPAVPLRFGGLGTAAPLAAASTAIAVVLAIGFREGRRKNRGAQGAAPPGRLVSGGAFVFLAEAFLLVAISSLAGRPIAIPGRLSSILLAPAALLVASSWAEAGRLRWAAAALAVIALASFAWEPNPGPPGGLDEVALAGRVLRAKARGPILVITVGLYGLPLRHDLRDRPNTRFLDYPEDVGHHLGWWAPRAFLANSARSSREAADVALQARAAAADGRMVFLYGADHPVAHPLRAALIGSFRPRLLNRFCPALQELVPRAPASP